MQLLTHPGRYKTIDALYTSKGFSCFTAVNIEQAQQTQTLICCYRDPAEIRRLLPILCEARERGCDELLEIMIEYGEVCAVFARGTGQPLAQALLGASPTSRRTIEEALFCRALELSRLPQEICNAVVRTDNALWQADAEKLVFPFLLCPERMVGGGNGCLTALFELSEQVLGRRWSSLAEELDFLDLLRGGEVKTVAQGYAAWRALCAATAERHAEHYAHNGFSLFFYGLKTRLARRKRRRG